MATFRLPGYMRIGADNEEHEVGEVTFGHPEDTATLAKSRFADLLEQAAGEIRRQLTEQQSEATP